MAAEFPAAIKNFTDPSNTSRQNSPLHSQQHIDVNAEVEAIETALGIGMANVIGSGAIDTDSAFTANSDSKIPSQKAVKSAVDAKLASSAIDTDGTMAADSDARVPSQKAVRTYAAGLIIGAGQVPLTYLDADETLAANSDVKIATQQATKSYVDGKTIAENKLSISDNTTANATTSAHGFLKKLSNVATEFMNGVGNWVAVTIDSILPSQAGNSGKFLTSNGTNASWGTLPSSGNKVAFGYGGACDLDTANNTTTISGLGFTPSSVVIIPVPNLVTQTSSISEVSATSFKATATASNPKIIVYTVNNFVSGGFDIVRSGKTGTNGGAGWAFYWIAIGT
jgi:hypothetical protein